MKILICGVGGRMGREVAKLALDGVRGAVPVAGYDVIPVDTREFRTYTDWKLVEEEPDCIIDFSNIRSHCSRYELLCRQLRL